jgi:myosin III
MMRSQSSQCILISGESGSGKTETCKYLVEHLLNRKKIYEFSLNDKIQEVNPLLEAFGNAKTRINDNSSRFGKYLEIYFEKDGTVVGAKFKEYLLEKSRVIYHTDKESTFHIFYLLFAGLSDDEKLKYGGLKSPDDYRFMRNNNNTSDSSNKRIANNCNENADRFHAIIESMKKIGFLTSDIERVIKVLVGVLLIGEIELSHKQNKNNDSVQIVDTQLIHTICQLLELDENELSDALVSDVQVTRGEEIKRERNMVQVCDVRDAFAKALYGRLFSWIVNQINHHIQPVHESKSNYSIGLLDIFGFENLEMNSFEQMCINLANEQLHQLFTKYIFKLEIEECMDEEVELNGNDLITYSDNQIILDLFLEKRLGLFALLDEESRFPMATDESLALKLHQSLGSSYPDVYIAPKSEGVSFQIVHYAGQVVYSMEGFLAKNRDFLPNNLFYAARNSNNYLVQELFECKLTRKGTLAPSDRQSKQRKYLLPTSSSSSSSSSSADYILPTIKEASSTSYRINQRKNLLNPLTVSNVFDANVENSSDSHSMSSNNNNIKILNNIYASDKAFPLTVACHFKVILFDDQFRLTV